MDLNTQNKKSIQFVIFIFRFANALNRQKLQSKQTAKRETFFLRSQFAIGFVKIATGKKNF